MQDSTNSNVLPQRAVALGEDDESLNTVSNLNSPFKSIIEHLESNQNARHKKGLALVVNHEPSIHMLGAIKEFHLQRIDFQKRLDDIVGSFNACVSSETNQKNEFLKDREDKGALDEELVLEFCATCMNDDYEIFINHLKNVNKNELVEKINSRKINAIALMVCETLIKTETQKDKKILIDKYLVAEDLNLYPKSIDRSKLLLEIASILDIEDMVLLMNYLKDLPLLLEQKQEAEQKKQLEEKNQQEQVKQQEQEKQPEQSGFQLVQKFRKLGNQIKESTLNLKLSDIISQDKELKNQNKESLVNELYKKNEKELGEILNNKNESPNIIKERKNYETVLREAFGNKDIQIILNPHLDSALIDEFINNSYQWIDSNPDQVAMYFALLCENQSNKNRNIEQNIDSTLRELKRQKGEAVAKKIIEIGKKKNSIESGVDDLSAKIKKINESIAIIKKYFHKNELWLETNELWLKRLDSLSGVVGQLYNNYLTNLSWPSFVRADGLKFYEDKIESVKIEKISNIKEGRKQLLTIKCQVIELLEELSSKKDSLKKWNVKDSFVPALIENQIEVEKERSNFCGLGNGASKKIDELKEFVEKEDSIFSEPSRNSLKQELTELKETLNQNLFLHDTQQKINHQNTILDIIASLIVKTEALQKRIETRVTDLDTQVAQVESQAEAQIQKARSEAANLRVRINLIDETIEKSPEKDISDVNAQIQILEEKYSIIHQRKLELSVDFGDNKTWLPLQEEEIALHISTEKTKKIEEITKFFNQKTSDLQLLLTDAERLEKLAQNLQERTELQYQLQVYMNGNQSSKDTTFSDLKSRLSEMVQKYKNQFETEKTTLTDEIERMTTQALENANNLKTDYDNVKNKAINHKENLGILDTLIESKKGEKTHFEAQSKICEKEIDRARTKLIYAKAKSSKKIINLANKYFNEIVGNVLSEENKENLNKKLMGSGEGFWHSLCVRFGSQIRREDYKMLSLCVVNSILQSQKKCHSSNLDNILSNLNMLDDNMFKEERETFEELKSSSKPVEYKDKIKKIDTEIEALKKCQQDLLDSKEILTETNTFNQKHQININIDTYKVLPQKQPIISDAFLLQLRGIFAIPQVNSEAQLNQVYSENNAAPSVSGR